MAKKNNPPAPRSEDKPAGQKRGPFHLEFLNQAQKMAWGAFDQHDVLFLLGPAGCGKALTMNSNLFTRNGPVEMREASIGMEIANPDGGFSKITGVYPQGKKQVCRVHFSDESHVDCCEEHLWSVSHSDNGWKNRVVDTRYLEENCRRSDGKRVLSLAATKPVNFDRKKYPIPPYLLGLFIAEGNLTNSNVVFTTCESEILGRATGLLADGYVCKSKGLDHRIVKGERSNKPNSYKEKLKKLGLWGHKSYEKFIPLEYQYGSVDQRISLLQGLMDGDGGVEKTGAISYCTTSYDLAEDFCHLVYSLGGTTRIRRKEGSAREDGSRHRMSYRCYVNLPAEIEMFFLSRKGRLVKARSKYKPKRYVSRVERLDEQEMQCISVDHKDSLYLTDNYTVTHNTHLACAFAISEILAKKKRKVILTRPIVEAEESLGYLPGTFEEKVSPYMLPMYDCIEKMVGPEGPQRDYLNRSMEVAPIAYMRGRSILNTELIPTPHGITKMGDIQLGDLVFGSDGNPTEVLGVYPQGVLSIYKVTFSDRTVSYCSEDHLWNTMTLNEKRHGKSYTTKTTREIANSVKNKHNQKIHRLPILSGPAQFSAKTVPVDPYLLGSLLGDGHNGRSMSLTNVDMELIERCVSSLPEDHKLVFAKDCTYRFTSSRKRNKIKSALKELGLYEKKSPHKFVPDVYKYNSVECRLSMLRALMDTDGWVCEHRSGNSRAQFGSTSIQLANDLMFLVRSLGGYAYCRKRDYGENDSHLHKNRLIKHNHSMYVVDVMLQEFNPFYISRKADRWKGNLKPTKLISSVELAGEGECTCIRVAAKDSLYLTNDFIVTHNTFDNAVCIFDEAQNATKMQLKLFMTRFGVNSKIIITGDPAQSDIRDPALMEVVRKLEDLPGIGVIHFKSSSIVRHPLIASILDRLEDKVEAK